MTGYRPECFSRNKTLPLLLFSDRLYILSASSPVDIWSEPAEINAMCRTTFLPATQGILCVYTIRFNFAGSEYLVET